MFDGSKVAPIPFCNSSQLQKLETHHANLCCVMLCISMHQPDELVIFTLLHDENRPRRSAGHRDSYGAHIGYSISSIYGLCGDSKAMYIRRMLSNVWFWPKSLFKRGWRVGLLTGLCRCLCWGMFRITWGLYPQNPSKNIFFTLFKRNIRWENADGCWFPKLHPVKPGGTYARSRPICLQHVFCFWLL